MLIEEQGISPNFFLYTNLHVYIVQKEIFYPRAVNSWKG